MASVRLTGIGTWNGGTVVDLAHNGNTVLAATFAGLYRSTDRGRTWTAVGENLPDWFIQAVVLAPVGVQAVGLAASNTGWLYRSMDGGETWEALSYWENLGIVTRLVSSPSFYADGTVFACTEEDGVFKTTDRGSNWKQANFGLLNLNAAALCFSPDFAQDEVVFAGTDGGGVFRSRNAGRAWRESGEGLPDSAVQCLAISPHFAQDGVVLAGTEDLGVYRSEDGGRTWGQVGCTLTEACINGIYMPADWDAGGAIVAATDEGLLLSADGGLTWQAAQGGPEYPYVVVGCDGQLLAGAYAQGVYLCPSGGEWESANDGLAAHLPPMTVFSEAFEDDGTLLMASMEGTLVRSEDAGQTWLSLWGDDEFVASAFAGKGKGDAMSLLAALDADLVRSQDAGATWESVRNTGADPLTAVAVSRSSHAMAAGTAGGQIFLSLDGGTSWRRVAQLNEVVMGLGVEGTVVYAVTAHESEGGGWVLTLQAGPPWHVLAERETGEPVAVIEVLGGEKLLCAFGRHVLYLEAGQVIAENALQGEAAISSFARADETLLAGTRLGLHRSTDGARSWEWLTSDISVVALHAASPERAYAVSMGGHMWRVDLGTAP